MIDSSISNVNQLHKNIELNCVDGYCSAKGIRLYFITISFNCSTPHSNFLQKKRIVNIHNEYLVFFQIQPLRYTDYTEAM